MSRQELTRRAGLHSNTVGKLTNNAYTVLRLGVLEAECRVLGVQPGDVFHHVSGNEASTCMVHHHVWLPPRGGSGTSAVTMIMPGGLAMPDTVRRWCIVRTSHPPDFHTRAERRCKRPFCASVRGSAFPGALSSTRRQPRLTRSVPARRGAARTGAGHAPQDGGRGGPPGMT